MLTCEITDIVDSDCQGITQVFDSLYCQKDEQCKSNEPDENKDQKAKKKPKNILSQRNIKVFNEHHEVNDETRNSFDKICKPVSPPVVSSTTSPMMAANSHKRRKKCRREYGHHKKHAKASSSASLQDVSCPISSADSISPKVTPIFVWANVDDTKIVHVLCEDYDKRNRIRLTRTAKGWRSVPLIESLEKCRQVAVSQSPLDSISPRLVHCSPTTSDNRLQTDNLSTYPTENEFSQKGESIGAIADSTNADHTFNEAVPLPSNSADDAFSSDEDGQQENLRCMIDKMQSDSLYSDDECEASVSTTQKDRVMIEDTHKSPGSSNSHAQSDNFITDGKTEETVTSPNCQKIVQESSLPRFSSSFTNNFNIMYHPSNSEVLYNNHATVSSPNLTNSSENILHQDSRVDEVANSASSENILPQDSSSGEVANSASPGDILHQDSCTGENKSSEIRLESLKKDNASKLDEASVSCSSAATDDNFNFSLDNHDQIENTDQSVDMEESITPHQVTSSENESMDLENDSVNSYSNTQLESENDSILSSQPLALSDCTSHDLSDNKKDGNIETSHELSLPMEISVDTDNVPDNNYNASLSGNFVDNNSNIINYSSNGDTLPTSVEKTVISSGHKRLLDDKMDESSTDQWIDNNSNIILESRTADKILDNIEDNLTSPCVSTLENITVNHFENPMIDSKNLCLSEVHEDQPDNDESKSITSENVIDRSNSSIDLDINQSEVDNERPLSTSLPVNPPPEKETTLQERYTNLSKMENSILSTLLQTDIIIGKPSEESVKNNNMNETSENQIETNKSGISLPASTSEPKSKNSSIENEKHQPEMLEEHSRTMEFLYRSYFESPFMIQDDDTRELLQSFQADNQCMDLSVHHKNIVEENGDKNGLLANVMTDEKSYSSNLRPQETHKSIEFINKDNKRLHCPDAQNNYNPSNMKSEVLCSNDINLCEKYKLDKTVQKVPLCQTLKSSNKCPNTRRLLMRKPSKYSEDENISDKGSSKEQYSMPYSSPISHDEPPSIDIKPSHQNIIPSKDFLSSSDKIQFKPMKSLKYLPPELVISKVPMHEKEKPIISAKPNTVIVPSKEKSTALDPLEQLKDVLSNPMYSVPDPLLVPKGRLPALVTCPGREIPRLLARRTQNSSYVSILSDPDVLVVSLSHLRSLMTKPLNENDIQEYQKHTEEIRSRLRLELLNYKAGLENASLYGASWSDYSGPATPSVPSSKGVSGSKGGTDDVFRGLSAACNPLNFCYPTDLGRDINGNCGPPYHFEKGPFPWSNDVLNGQKLNLPTYDPCGVSWNDQLCAHLGCFQTASGTCSLGRNDLMYCPFDSQLQNSFPPYLHSTLSCTNRMPMLRDFGTKNCLPEFCYPWMDFARSSDDKGRHQKLENPFEHLQCPPKACSQPASKPTVELKIESASFDEPEKVAPKIQSKESSAADEQPDKRSQSVEPKIKVRQHLVDPNRRPLLLNPQLRSPYESSSGPFLRPWNSEGFPHPFWFR